MNIKEKTHITHDDIIVPKLLGKIDLNNDNIGNVELYDFSRANVSKESRIYYISKVASVCYQNPKALGSISLYDRLSNESKGLPSSSFEFVPVLLPMTVLTEKIFKTKFNNCIKYGEFIDRFKEDKCLWLLTNLRALISDVGEEADKYLNDTEHEIAIIKKHFKIFKCEIDSNTRTQFIRHRMSPQELSRRYVSGKKAAFSFYISDKMKEIETSIGDDGTGTEQFLNTEDLYNLCLDHYNNAIAKGVKPEDARRCIPQSMYTTIWSAWSGPSILNNFYKLRLDDHAQKEIRSLAEAMYKLDKGYLYDKSKGI